MDLGCDGWRHLVDNNAQFGFIDISAVFWIRLLLWIAQVRKHLIAVADGDSGILRLAIAYVAQPDGRTGPAAGDFVYQVIAILDIPAVDSGDDVSRLETSFICRAAHLHLLHQDAILETIDAIDSTRKLCVELNSNGAARDLVSGADEVVVDRDD